jgi:hypothetical protein
MTGSKTPTRQFTEIGEGLAAGVLASGTGEIIAQKLTVQLAFQSAWRDWIYASRFPHVRADLDRNHIYGQIIGRSERRRGSRQAAWIKEGLRLTPHVDPEWTPSEVLDTLADVTGVPADGWTELASLFLAGLELGSGGAPSRVDG